MRAIAQRLEFIENYLVTCSDRTCTPSASLSLACGVLGVMTSASLAVSVIGQALAQARGKSAKHAIKQVDRLLSNQGIDVWALFPLWIKDMIGESTAISSSPWTGPISTLTIRRRSCSVSSPGTDGRTPLLWFSVFKAELEGKRNDIEDMCLVRLKEALPGGAKATILADRGFGDAKLFGFLGEAWL